MGDTLADLVIKLRADFGDVAPELGTVATAVKEVGNSAEDAGKAIQSGIESQLDALYNQGLTVAEAMAQLGASFSGVAEPMAEAGAAAAAAAVQLGLFDEAANIPWADAAGQLNLFATELEPIGAAAASASAGLVTMEEAAAMAAAGITQFSEGAQALITKQSDLEAQLESAKATLEEIEKAYEAGAVSADVLARAEAEVAEALKAVKPPAEEAENALAAMGEKMIALGEALAITEGLKEFGQEALAASDTITKASISLTVLTGSGEKAKTVIEEIEALGIKDGLALPGLLQAATRMTNLLGASAPVPELLAKIADGAAVMGTSVEAAANSFDRIATMGSLGARQLMPLGLTLEKVAAAMNEVTGKATATGETVSKMFKEMEEGATTADKVKLRTEVLSVALGKLAGVAEDTAKKTFGGQWQTLVDQWEQVMRQAGDALLPVISRLTDFMKIDVLPFLKELSEGFNALPGPVKEVAVGLGILLAAVVPLTLAIGGFMLAIEAAGAAFAPVLAGLVSLGAGFAGAGASYVAMLATGILTVGVWVALAAAVASLGYALMEMIKAENLAAAASKSASDSLAAYEANLRQHGIDISNLKKQYDEGLISYEAYKKGLDELRDAYLKLHPVSQEAAEGTKAVMNASEAAAAKIQVLRDAVQSAADKLGDIQAKSKGTAADTVRIAAAYDEWQKATNALNTALKGHKVALTEAERAVQSFGKSTQVALAEASVSYEDYLASLYDGGKKASSVLATLTQDILKGEQQLEKMSGKPKAAMEALIASLKVAQATMRDFSERDDMAVAVAKMEAAQKSYAEKVEAFRDALDEKIKEDQEKALLNAEKSAAAHAERMLELERSSGEARLAAHQITAFEMEAINKKVSDAEVAAEDEALQKELADLDTFAKDYATKYEAILSKINALKDKTTNKATLDGIKAETEAWKVLGITSVTALETQVKEANQALEVLKQRNAPMADLLAGEEKQLNLEAKLAEAQGRDASYYISQLIAVKGHLEEIQVKTHSVTEELYAQMKADQGIYDALVKANAPLVQQYDQLEKNYNEKIKYKELTEQSATSEIVGLEILTLKQKALWDQTHLEGEVIKSAVDDTIKAFTGMSSSIAQVIVEGGNMGKVFVDTAKKIAEAILSDIIKGALQSFVDMIISCIPTIGSLVPAVHTVSGSIVGMQTAMQTATVAMTANITALTTQFTALASAITGVGTAAGGAGGASGIGSGGTGIASKGGSGIASGPIGLGAAIANAISSIIGNFQMAHMETSLNAIEHNTRFFQIEAEKFFQQDSWDQQKGIVDTLDMTYDRLGDIWHAISVIGDLLGANGGDTGGPQQGGPRKAPPPGTGTGGDGGDGGVGTRNPNDGTYRGGGAGNNPPPAAPTAPYNPFSGVGGQVWGGLINPPAGQSAAAMGRVIDSFSNLPQFDDGGPVPFDMVAQLHAGEQVLSRSDVASQREGSVGPVAIHINGALDPREIARQVGLTLKNLLPRMTRYST